MKIVIERIGADLQRYPTLGDWYFDAEGALQIRVSAESEDQAFLYALHELIEVWLCKRRGIDQAKVDRFDMEFEKNRTENVRALRAELRELVFDASRLTGDRQAVQFEIIRGTAERLTEVESEEPGDQKDAPYRREHRFAMLIEHLMAAEMGIEGYGAVE